MSDQRAARALIETTREARVPSFTIVGFIKSRRRKRFRGGFFVSGFFAFKRCSALTISAIVRPAFNG